MYTLHVIDNLRTLPVPNVDGNAVREWFCNVKGFKDTDLLQIVPDGAAVEVSGHGDLHAALHYGIIGPSHLSDWTSCENSGKSVAL